MSAPMPARIRVTGPDGLASVLPGIVGFHPEKSLVMVCLGADRALGPVARVDLDATNAVPALAACADRHASGGVILVTYGSDLGNREPVIRALLDALPIRVTVVDSVHLDDAPAPVHPDVMAAAVMGGRAVLTGRDALAASVEGPAGVCLVKPDDSLRLTAILDGHPRDVTATDAVTLAARMAASVTVRDLILARMPAVPLMVALAGMLPDSVTGAADVCAVLAGTAYADGDGALANLAVDRALRIDPGHTLARMMVQAFTLGITPVEFVRVIRDAVADGA